MPTLESTLMMVAGFVALAFSLVQRRIEISMVAGEAGWGIPVVAAVGAGLFAIRFELQHIQQTTLGDLHVAGYAVQDILFGHILVVGIIASIMLAPYHAGGVWRNRVRWMAPLVAFVFLSAISYELLIIIPNHLEFVIYI